METNRRPYLLTATRFHRGAESQLILALLLPCSLTAQNPPFEEPAFTIYGMEAGLSQGTVNAILQDSVGIIWIGTQDGLNRFDGVEFRAFKHIRGDATSLSDDLVLALVDAGSDRLWVGTERGGLNLFDARTGQSLRYELHELGAWQMDAGGSTGQRGGRSVNGIIPVVNGSLVISTDVGLAVFQPSNGGARILHLDGTTQEDGPPTASCNLPGGGGLVGFRDGSVHRIEPDLRSEVVLEIFGSITAIRCPGETGGLAATSHGEVYSLSLTSLRAELLHRFETTLGEPIFIQDVLLDTRHLLWVATTRGLFVVQNGGPAHRVGAGSQARRLPAEEVERLFVDRAGMLWVGTWNGLVSIHPRSLQTRRVLRTQGALSGLSGNGVVAIESTDDGGLWIGTLGGGIDHVEPHWRSDSAVVSEPEAFAAWPNARVFSLAGAADGRLWIATLGDGIIVLDTATGQAHTVPVTSLDGTARENTYVFSVFEDGSGTVWAGTDHAGLVRYDPSTERFEEYRGPDGDWHFGSRWVWPIAEDAEGRLWVGAFNGGLTSIDPAREECRFYDAGPTALSDNRILSLFAGARGYIWIGTQGGGLNRLDPETDSIKVFTVEDGLPHDHVEGIIGDDAGFLWITTNDGVARFDPGAEEFWVLKEPSGLAGNRFFANAVHKNERGELFFGGEAGLTILDPSQLEPSSEPPPVALTEFQIHGRSVPLARALDPRLLDLEPNENFFTFEFAALDFTDPKQNRYRYQLENLDEEWIEAGSNRVANYTSVPPGRYVFRVEARNADGVWNKDGLAIPLRVQTPYHQTWWFRSTIGLAVLLLISGIYSYRLRELHRRQTLRLAIAGGLHDDIGGNLATIIRKADRVEKVFGPEDDYRLELGRVSDLARDTEFKVREAVWAVKEEYDNLEALVTKLRHTAETMLEGHTEHDFKAPANIPDRRISWETRRDVYFFFKEALNNVLKHAEATFVAIEVAYNAPFLSLRVADNGKGFDPASSTGGHGVGRMRKYAKRYQDEDPVHSEVGKGTTVQARVRIG